MSKNPVFVALNNTGAQLARRLMAVVPGAELHGFAKRVSDADVPFARVQPHIRELYSQERPVIAIMSTGIIIRALGDLAVDKHSEAAVVAIGEAGQSVVPLLGGHNGANKLAALLANELGVAPAITTAGDGRFGFALDEPVRGWRVSNPDAAKDIMAALLAGDAIQIKDDTADTIDKTWLALDELKTEDGAEHVLSLTEAPAPDGFALHPQTVVIGIGAERNVDAGEVMELIEATLAAANISKASIAAIASLDLKENETAILEAAATLEVPLRLFTKAALEAETPRVAEPSEIVFKAVGCHSVAEAAALAGVGGEGSLVVPKAKSKRATCAIAQAPIILDAHDMGRACGRLTIVGIGPGYTGWRAPDATSAVAEATDLVGYSLYLDLLGGLADGKTRHDYPLGEETERVAHALDLAAAGKCVALISSGDAGIYAMGSLVFELIDHAGDDHPWRRLAVAMVPGISALQAAAARIGAPLGHDFCTISLSDLMTPWEVIEKRLSAAAAGDFVIALYNPVSKRRRTQFETAKERILEHRPPATPVIIARNLGRDTERVSV
ncbi:MAG: cobalamin biosynthesis protein, partial [Rhodospirillales bacterium]|nr:cobalamin biosynthesis protein [Rhodospirillales bacterium]